MTGSSCLHDDSFIYRAIDNFNGDMKAQVDLCLREQFYGFMHFICKYIFFQIEAF